MKKKLHTKSNISIISTSFFVCMASRELEIPWEEEYVLAENKEEALRKLLPSTEDYYFYHILHKFVYSICYCHSQVELISLFLQD